MRIIARVTPSPGDPEIVIAEVTKEDHPRLLKNAKEFINKNRVFSKDVNEAHVAHPTDKEPTTDTFVFVGAHNPSCNAYGLCIPKSKLG